MHDAGKEGVQRTVRAYTTCSTRDRKRHDVVRTVRLKNSTHGWPNEQPSRDMWGSVQAAGNRSAASQPEEGSDARTDVRRARYTEYCGVKRSQHGSINMYPVRYRIIIPYSGVPVGF